jgi:subtilase family serine protease
MSFASQISKVSTLSKALPAARLSLGLLALGMVSATGIAQSLDAHVAPAITRFGRNLGLESPSTKLTLTAWLNLHDRAAFDAKVKGLYTKGSPTYHQWLKDADVKAFSPTAAEVATVKAQLAAHNLKVTSVDPLNLSIRFEGKTSDIESALNTQISRYLVKGDLVHTSSSQPRFSGAAASLVHHVAGLNSMKLQPMLSHPTNPKTRKPFAGVPLAVAKAKSNGLVYASECFYAPSSVTLTGVNAYDGVTPVTSSFSGLTYGANPNNTAVGTLSPCGYSPAQVQKFYGLDVAYGLGYTGTGQTIVIIDSYLEPTAKPDLVAFSKLYHLPGITASNYAEYNPYGANTDGALYGVDEETDLDLQWAHATAPGANLALVQTFSEDEEDQQAGILWAVTQHLGNVISLSYGYPEFYTGPLALDIFSEVAEIAAAEGVSLHASSGDEGDDSVYGNGLQVDAPADSPYATAIGGTSIGTSPLDGSLYTTGWGNNIGFLSFDATDPYDPPFTEFYAGSGGGTSAYFAKPAYQSALWGSGRMVPDVSALADPFTGAEFVYTDPDSGGQYVGVIGGTSLAAPIFSGIWTLVNEYSGVSLGQAAPYIAAAPNFMINDVLPLVGPYNVTGTITDPMGTTAYSATDLSQPLFTTTQFVSTLWNIGGGEYLNLTFGTDTSLNVTQGWDNVTGYGTPNVGEALTVLGAGPKQ